MIQHEADAACPAIASHAARSIWQRLPWPLCALAFYGCLVFLGALLLGGNALASIFSLVLPQHLRRDSGRALISGCFRIFLAMAGALRLIRLDLGALDALNAESGLIIAPNHPSMLDALLIASRIRHTGCIMKAGLWDNPFLGAGARLAGYIRNDSISSMIRQAAADLEQGSKLLVFPEGTRTTRWPVDPLKGGIAVIAQRAGAPIQTVLIETGSPYLTKGWPIWKIPPLPLSYRATLGPRFSVSSFPSGRVETMAAMQSFFDEALSGSVPPGSLSARQPSGLEPA